MTLTRLFPIVDRELRVSSRQKLTYWNRVLAAGLALGIFFLCGLAMMRAPVHYLGQALFYSLSALAGIICALAGSSVVDSVSSEKREGTLGLLFLTNLSGYSVVSGKIAAASLGAVYRLLAIIPILAITFLLGGVDMGDYLRVIAGCANLMFLSLAIGVYWSARMLNAWAAALAWLGTMAFMTIGWPMLMILLVELLEHTWLGTLLFTHENMPYLLGFLTPSPGFSAVLAIGPQQFFGSMRWAFWASLGVQLVIALLALISACRRTQRTWRQQDRQLSRPGRGKSVKEAVARYVHRSRWRHVRVGNENAISWLVRRSRLGWNVTVVVLTLATLGYLLGLIFEYSDFRDSDNFPVVMGLMHVWLLAWMAGESSAWIFRDRQSGGLELILATPLTVSELLRGHFRGITRKLFIPVAWVLTVDMVMMIADRNRYHPYVLDNWFLASYFTAIFWGCCVGMLFFNLYTIRWTATWMGLISRNEFTAAIASLVWLSLPTWGTIAGGTFFMVLIVEVWKIGWVKNLLDGIHEVHLLAGWLLLATVNNLLLLWISRRECARLRDLAALRPESGFWAQIKYVIGLFQPRLERE